MLNCQLFYSIILLGLVKKWGSILGGEDTKNLCLIFSDYLVC